MLNHISHFVFRYIIDILFLGYSDNKKNIFNQKSTRNHDIEQVKLLKYHTLELPADMTPSTSKDHEMKARTNTVGDARPKISFSINKQTKSCDRVSGGHQVSSVFIDYDEMDELTDTTNRNKISCGGSKTLKKIKQAVMSCGTGMLNVARNLCWY